MRRQLTLVFAGGLLTLPALAAAQPGATPATESAPSAAAATPRVDFGVGMGHVVSFGDGIGLGSIDLRATGRVTRWLAIEFVADVATDNLGPDHLFGFYLLQGRFLLHESGNADWRAFATFGALGVFEHASWGEQRFQSPDGSAYVWPGGSYSEVTRPTEVVGGAAVEKVLARHLAVRGDAQVIVCPYGEFLGMRLAGGVSVPLGRYRVE